jgi:hypothetical protein
MQAFCMSRCLAVRTEFAEADMKYKLSIALGLLTGVLMFSVSLFAHHGNAAFDSSKKITLKGTVTDWIWSNPHCLLKFDVKDTGGQITHWIAETQAPINMVPTGWRQQSFKPGDEITIIVEPMRSGRPYGRIELVTLPNGSQLKGQTVFKEDQYAPKP